MESIADDGNDATKTFCHVLAISKHFLPQFYGIRYAITVRVTKKTSIFKPVPAIQDGLEGANHHSASLPAALYLALLRTPPVRISLPRELRKIAVETENGSLTVCDVKIIQAD